jgi:hypothetical protein
LSEVLGKCSRLLALRTHPLPRGGTDYMARALFM